MEKKYVEMTANASVSPKILLNELLRQIAAANAVNRTTSTTPATQINEKKD